MTGGYLHDMKYYNYLFVCLFLVSSFFSFAQSPRIDSLKNVLKTAKTAEQKSGAFNLLSEEYIKFNIDTAELYSYKALDLARTIKDKKNEVLAISNLGLAVARKGEEREAIAIYREGLELAKQVNIDTLTGRIHRNIGVSYYHLTLYDSALTHYFNALSLYKKAKDIRNEAIILNNIGSVYYFLKRTDDAEDFYTLALNKYIDIKDDKGLAKQYGNLGLIYIINSDTAKAVEYSKKSLEYNLKINDPPGIATSSVNLAYAYKLSKHYKEALIYAERSLQMRTKIGDKKGIATSTIMLGNIYYSMNDFRNAITYFEKGLDLSQQIGLRIYEIEDIESLARSYLALGNFSKAEKLFKRKKDMEDSLYNNVFAEKVAQLETQYQTKQKDNEIKLLTQESEIQELSLKRNSAYLWGAVAVIALLWVILGVSYSAYKNKEKSNALLAKQNTEISRQKKEITDSIDYAQTIQRAILPPEKLLEKHLPDSFVLFKPKDVVSGDFYWTIRTEGEGQVTKGEGNNKPSPVTRHSSLVYFAAVDCTGHGVPGAFMSIIGHNSLNRTVKDLQLTHPAEILDKLVELVTEALRAENQGEVKDGMDLALCCLDENAMKLEYAGAYNPLLIVRKGELIEYKADRQPIGAFEKRKPYTNHTIELEKGDCIYIFSDGVADQFGGPKGKKFGSKRLKELLLSVAQLPAKEQHEKINSEFTKWQGKEEQTDDVTLIGVRV